MAQGGDTSTGDGLGLPTGQVLLEQSYRSAYLLGWLLLVWSSDLVTYVIVVMVGQASGHFDLFDLAVPAIFVWLAVVAAQIWLIPVRSVCIDRSTGTQRARRSSSAAPPRTSILNHPKLQQRRRGVS